MSIRGDWLLTYLSIVNEEILSTWMMMMMLEWKNEQRGERIRHFIPGASLSGQPKTPSTHPFVDSVSGSVIRVFPRRSGSL